MMESAIRLLILVAEISALCLVAAYVADRLPTPKRKKTDQ